MQPSAVIPSRSGGKKLVFIVVGAVVAAVLAVAIVASSKSGGGGNGSGIAAAGGSGNAAAGGSGRADSAGVGLATATPDASPADAADQVAEVTVDAGQKDATQAQTTQGGKDKRTGRLVVHAFPVQTVWVDDRKVHDTPVDMKLSVGRHKLKLVNSETGKTETVSVTIDETKPTTIERN
jgi:hypothetical protein